ncbi:energy transducer TonB [Syntrophobacter fumaroxidans]|uniref:TonB family protein n=1 Tax=Syntrophobacter fumaroxidans (strain DSM 10017 / MPOB) TaxID=335543 RepID=A0LLW8_SYNFM|nr:energy transducer TonB [Syntrophobacter fumaroxidans]ABK18420.1 TonB family protein [Syntrophobacter fumaroxidans MPOB]
MRIWPNLLFSILFHAALLGWLAFSPPFLRPETERCLIVDLVALDADPARGGTPGGGKDVILAAHEPKADMMAEHSLDMSAASAAKDSGTEHGPNPGGTEPPARIGPSQAASSVSTPKPTKKADARRNDREKHRWSHARRHAATRSTEPEGTGERAPGTERGASASRETGHGERPRGNAGGGHGDDAGSSGVGAGNSSSEGPIDAPLGSANGPRFVTKVMPKYPHRARELGMEGTVVLRVTIDTRGMPVRVESVRKAGFGFEEEAIRAIRSSIFSPARIGGRLVACRVLVPVRFQLETSADD